MAKSRLVAPAGTCSENRRWLSSAPESPLAGTPLAKGIAIIAAVVAVAMPE
jgi:hypothetical protein